MRLHFLLCSIVLMACHPQTLPVTSLPAYAAHRPVLTLEGDAVSLDDGGTLKLVPHGGTCLRRRAVVEGAVVLGVAEGTRCRSITVPLVERVEAGPLLRIRGRTNSIEVDPELVAFVELGSANRDATYYAPRTGVRSAGMIAGGSLLMAAGVAGAIAAFTALAGVEGDADSFAAISRAIFGLSGVASLGAGFGAGIPLVVLGARQVRLPQAEQPAVTGVELGGIGLRWALR